MKPTSQSTHSATRSSQRSDLFTREAVLSLAAIALFVSGSAPLSAQQTTAAPPVDTAQFGNSQALCTPQVIGNRRIPKESVLARLFSHQGDLFDPQLVERDFNSLWNTGYFESVRIEKVETPQPACSSSST